MRIDYHSIKANQNGTSSGGRNFCGLILEQNTAILYFYRELGSGLPLSTVPVGVAAPRGLAI